MQTLGNQSSASGVSGNDAFSKISTVNTKAVDALAGKLKVNSYNNEQQLATNHTYEIPDMSGIYLIFFSRANSPSNSGVYFTQCHADGVSHFVLPLAEVTATNFSLSFNGTSLVVNTGDAQPRVRFLRLTNANY
jgi:hypothetical protein